jgi:hypothetical protein
MNILILTSDPDFLLTLLAYMPIVAKLKKAVYEITY